MANDASKTVMVVDDDPSARMFVSSVLQAEGFRTVVATDGVDAVQQLGDLAPPDLMLLDIEMPGKSGYQVLEWLRENPATAGVPVVFLTVKYTTEDQKRGLREGVVDYLSKEILTPDKVAILIYRVRNFFTWQENERLRGVLATIVSANHEINNPLMVIQGGADLIRIKGMLESREDGLKALERITTACHTIADVLSRITGLTAWARTDYLDGVEMLDLGAASTDTPEPGDSSKDGD